MSKEAKMNEKIEYRKQLYKDLFSNRVPDRVPIQDSLNVEYMIQYCGFDLMETQYDYTDEKLNTMFKKVADDVMRGDLFPSMYARNAVAFMLDGNIANQMGSNGMIQHPEISFMEAEEYDDFIKNPFDFLLEKVSTRNSRQFQKGEVFRSRALLMKTFAMADQNAMFGRASVKAAAEHDMFMEPPGSCSVAQPPFDLIADFCRGFSKIPLDMRRCPDKLQEAMDAAMPFLLAQSVPSKPDILGAAKVMTHMAAFLNTKQFEKFYFPHFNELTHINLERGFYMTMFLEQDWTRFIDYLMDMPMGTRFYMERGDYREFKEKMGKKFVLGGFYPLELLRAATKEQCIDKAKEIIDIMAPGGNYYFTWSKSGLSINDIDVDNYVGVSEYVRDNTKYDNAGDTVYDCDPDTTIHKGLMDKYPPFTSKYVLSFDEYMKEYPPVSDAAIPHMRKAYNKYLSMVALNRSC